MYFINNKEVNYELYYKNTFLKILINKKNYSNKYFFLEKPKIEFFFWTKRIKEEDLDFEKLFNNCIFFWLITGKLGQIKNLNIKLRRGIKYYRYIYLCKTSFFFKTLNFINEIFSSSIYKNTVIKHINKKNIYLISYNDLSIFTNLKLSNSFYLSSLKNKIFLKIKTNKKNIDLNIFLNCLKLK